MAHTVRRRSSLAAAIAGFAAAALLSGCSGVGGAPVATGTPTMGWSIMSQTATAQPQLASKLPPAPVGPQAAGRAG